MTATQPLRPREPPATCLRGLHSLHILHLRKDDQAATNFATVFSVHLVVHMAAELSTTKLNPDSHVLLVMPHRVTSHGTVL